MTTDHDLHEHRDVIIVGAGLSGIGAAYRLQTGSPGKTYALLEARDGVGGTWDLFRYPGIRSDSDMYTLSFPYRPWTNKKSIADGADILNYIEEAADEFGIRKNIRFGHRVVSASWSSDDARWTVTSEVDGATIIQTASFLYLCSGYYSYNEAYQPEFEGLDSFSGEVVHPQFWPDDLDYADKEVVIIGSGATAVTLIPSMAEKAKHITMLQRSPTYILSQPGEDKLAHAMRKVLPANLAQRAIRRKNATLAIGFYVFCKRFPKLATRILLGLSKRQLPEDYDLKNFTPRYNPWDQRLCLVPNGDLYKTIRRGAASVVTDRIKSFTPTGIDLESGAHLDADLVITATGLKVVAFGEMSLTVDGKEINAHELYVYKGMMYSGVPNFAWCVGYTNASWTLRADLTSKYVSRFINHLDDNGYAFGMPDPVGAAGQARPILDLTSGYVTRVADTLPQQGSESPWTIRQNWLLDPYDMRRADLDEGMIFAPKKVAVSAS